MVLFVFLFPLVAFFSPLLDQTFFYEVNLFLPLLLPPIPLLSCTKLHSPLGLCYPLMLLARSSSVHIEAVVFCCVHSASIFLCMSGYKTHAK